jgi:hypothetical protein
MEKMSKERTVKKVVKNNTLKGKGSVGKQERDSYVENDLKKMGICSWRKKKAMDSAVWKLIP